VTSLAMVATPLARQGGPTRRVLSTVVVVGSCTTTVLRAVERWGPVRAGAAVSSIAAGTALVERVGTATGLPFGRYHYTSALRPQVGGVPVIVPLAWFAMAVPAREVAVSLLGGRATVPTRAALGSVALAAWDLFLDPQMVGEGYWRWAAAGAYRGIPLSNYLGWLVTGVGVMALLEALLPPHDEADPVLVGEYGVMAAMETVGFAAFFRDRVVAVVGGAVMGSLAAGAVARRALGSPS
jgi:putative membrane protein